MRRDSLFYKLFQQYPSLLFELLTDPPINAQAYRFDSVAVKEPTFAIDGVFEVVGINIDIENDEGDEIGQEDIPEGCPKGYFEGENG